MIKGAMAACAAAWMLLGVQGAGAAQGDVMVSVKPVHSLVAAVMQGVAVPQLIVEGAGSPHTYSMRPSQAEALEKARLVFWVGPDLEHFLEKPLQVLAGNARIVTLEDAPGLVKLAPREGGAFEPEEEEEEEGHHAHETIDPHLWLDPENARAMVDPIADALSEEDPDNAGLYAANAKALKARLDGLEAETRSALASVKGKPFIVFHDAYHYFEHRFGVTAAGSITVDPQIAPGAARLREIHDKITQLGAVCVFAEPQFPPKTMQVATEGTDARTGVLDPLGADIADGPDLYFKLVGNLAASLEDCLSGEG